MEKYLEKVPTWALCYLINDDSTGLEDEEIQMIDDFMKSYQDEFPNRDIIVSPKYDDDEDLGQYFTTVPAFGKPTDVADCWIVVF